MSDEEISLEYEMCLADEGKLLKSCPVCELITHRDDCPVCDITLTGDHEADDALARLEAGEDVDLEALVGRKKPDESEWEPVTFT